MPAMLHRGMPRGESPPESPTPAEGCARTGIYSSSTKAAGCGRFLRIPLCGHSDTLVWALWGVPSTAILVCGELCHHVSGGRPHHWGVVVTDARSCVFTILWLAILLAPELFAIVVRLIGLVSTFQDCFDRTPRDPRS
jgi:hypothetical protein